RLLSSPAGPASCTGPACQRHAAADGGTGRPRGAGALAPSGLPGELAETSVARAAARARTAAGSRERRALRILAPVSPRCQPCATTRRSCGRCPGSRRSWRRSWACGGPRRAAPLGALLLERCRVAQEEPGGFSISFVEDPERKYHFECCSQEQCEQWTEALRRASYEYMRRSLIFYRNEIQKMTGKDPLEQFGISEETRFQLSSLPRDGQSARVSSRLDELD
uniref:Sesquipedalian n=1 Tax=Sciurus vulgaris TaxID=55149 RepID=A0A8D2DMR6_SCIVU